MLPCYPLYLITLSALANTFGGIVRPICLAVLRLITSSNFVGSSTGSSEGFAPLYSHALPHDVVSGAIGHEASSFDVVARSENARESVLRREIHDLRAIR